MEFFSQPVVAVILLLGILVVVHEAGHFIVGKLCKIPVEIFSIGFGPTIFGFQIRETHYRLSLIPLGGFVKFYGAIPSEEVPEALKGREFYNASIGARLITIAAGPIANLILAVVAYAGLISYGLKLPPALVGEIIPNSPAERAGLQFGDTITSINDKPIVSWRDVTNLISGSADETIQLKIKRDQQDLAISLSPESVKDDDMPGKRGRIGISPNLVPSTVTRVSDEGVLSAAGMQTGDRLLRVEMNGTSTEVKYWRQVQKFFSQFSTPLAAPLDLNLIVRTENPDSAETPLPERTLKATLPAGFRWDGSKFQELLGVTHGQLTIFKSEEQVPKLQQGDLLLEWDGKPLLSAFDLSQLIGDNRRPQVDLKILRKEVVQNITVPLKGVEVQRVEGRVTLYTLPVQFWGGLETPELVEERYTNPVRALRYGIEETFSTTKAIAKGIGALFTGELPLAAISGPIGIAKVASDSVRLGWQFFINSLAVISINLALINLIPIPVLDGGQMVLIGAEAGLRRRVSEVAIENYQKLGFMMVLALVVIATYNDLGRFWASMLKGVSSMF
ncbi:MAG TPA: site-2 protease family protein [Oligoflexus sp.]|uniref:site-2 protease family protein n=1 Tax=Oligoflexus sp. TaxID=1971216 RepID=UPI002D71DFB9|nr:site-2 protease family protein [Oligoflexus sp.]HYX34051.1 site-2 protease family protein [Oligoflexus sp.]